MNLCWWSSLANVLSEFPYTLAVEIVYFFADIVTFHVSEPYSKIVFTLLALFLGDVADANW